MNLGLSLKIALAKKGIKSKDLAEALKTTAPQVSIWCKTGEISKYNLVKISRFFGYKVSEFVALGED